MVNKTITFLLIFGILCSGIFLYQFNSSNATETKLEVKDNSINNLNFFQSAKKQLGIDNTPSPFFEQATKYVVEQKRLNNE
jgi:hypothetical protein